MGVFFFDFYAGKKVKEGSEGIMSRVRVTVGIIKGQRRLSHLNVFQNRDSCVCPGGPKSRSRWWNHGPVYQKELNLDEDTKIAFTLIETIDQFVRMDWTLISSIWYNKKNRVIKTRQSHLLMVCKRHMKHWRYPRMSITDKTRERELTLSKKTTHMDALMDTPTDGQTNAMQWTVGQIVL